MKTSLPTRIDMPSRIARVRGSTMRVVVPWPLRDMISTWPPMPWMLRLTTSMPTPRPETSLTSLAVEKPGAKISCHTSSSLMVSETDRPLSRALASSLSRSRPAPSSITSMRMLPPWCWAESVRRPVRGLPAASRVSGSSMP